MIDSGVLSSRIRALPTLSSALAELDSVLAKPQATLDDVERIIRHDPALSANLLRVVNSGLYALPRRADSIRQACLLIGLRKVRQLAVTSALATVVPARLPGYEVDSEGYWTHSVAVALLSLELSAPVGRLDPDQAFLGGLLHDIGKLALASFLAEAGSEVTRSLNQDRRSMLATERALFGTDHAAVGADLAQHWKLPAFVGPIARLHHEPDLAQALDDKRLVDLVHVADALAHLLGCGCDIGELARQPSPDSLARLGLRQRQLEAAASAAWERIADARNVGGRKEMG